MGGGAGLEEGRELLLKEDDGLLLQLLLEWELGPREEDEEKEWLLPEERELKELEWEELEWEE